MPQIYSLGFHSNFWANVKIYRCPKLKVCRKPVRTLKPSNDVKLTCVCGASQLDQRGIHINSLVWPWLWEDYDGCEDIGDVVVAIARCSGFHVTMEYTCLPINDRLIWSLLRRGFPINDRLIWSLLRIGFRLLGMWSCLTPKFHAKDFPCLSTESSPQLQSQ